MISHRLSSVQDMKKIIVLKDGRITEQGTHGQLMEAGGEYAALYQMQAERYRMETAFSDPRAVFTKSSMAEQGGVKG